MLRTTNSYRSPLNHYNRMCGIAGQFNFQRHEPVEREAIVRMARSIAHRGPDDEGFFISGPVGLGFRRLSIIDIAGGHQPMSNTEQTVWIIFNGEIYNYKELRAELQSKGHQFRTNSDTEVIIHGYEEWGTDVFNHLNGMFGLAIWDVFNQRLVVARDAMGIKLVYYRLANGQLTFGSEIRAVLAADDDAQEVDPAAVNLFLRFRYTPSPYTIFKGVRKLAGLLLALMNEHGNSWPAYTIGYGKSFADDELFDAAETASVLGARHVTVMLDRAEFERSLPGIVECLEEPVAASSIVPMYFVSQRARQDVKVALIGQGPDELFGGYKRHLGVHYGNWWRGLPASLRSMAGFAVNRLPRNEMLKRGVRSLGSEDRLKRYQNVFSLTATETIDGLFRDDVLPRSNSHELVDSWRELLPQMKYTDELGGFQLLEVRSSLPDELLMYADKLSMAHSLEVRVPYLDRTVVEYVQRLGANLKVRNGTRKWLHRRVCQSYLSSRILKRKKRGFASNVVDQWFHSSLNGGLSEVLLDESSFVFGLLDPKPVRRLLEGHQSGRQDNHKLLFSLVMIEQWLRGARSRTSAAYICGTASNPSDSIGISGKTQ